MAAMSWCRGAVRAAAAAVQTQTSAVAITAPRATGSRRSVATWQARLSVAAPEARCFATAVKKSSQPSRPKEELLRDAAHHDVPVRRKAVKGLGKYKDDDDAIRAIAKALGDEDVAVQLAAQAAMAKVAAVGDERTVRASLAQVSSTCEWTRIAGLSTLADITGRHAHPTRGTPLDLEVDEAVRGRLHDDDWGVRRAAMDTMAVRASPNCPDAIKAARSLLEDQMGTVRESAIKAIALLVPKGSQDAIEWIAPRLDDWHESVRRAAVVGIGRIADKGDQKSVELEKGSCDDRSWIVRKAATDSLAQTATLNDLPSLRKLARMLEDFDPLPRMAAIYGIAELCGVGHRKAIKLAEARLQHRDPGTRQAAVQLLEKLATNDREDIIRKVQDCMDDEDEHVRDSAFYALEAIKKNVPGRRKWKSDLPDLGDLDRIGLDSSDEEDERKES